MTEDTDLSPSAARTRRYRRRKREGVVAVVSVPVHKAHVDRLMRLGLLTADGGEDRGKITTAVELAFWAIVYGREHADQTVAGFLLGLKRALSRCEST